MFIFIPYTPDAPKYHYLIHLMHLMYLIYLIHLVHLIYLRYWGMFFLGDIVRILPARVLYRVLSRLFNNAT